MPREKMWVDYDDDARLSQSQKRPGAYSPLTRDGDNNLGQVTLSPVDDDDDDDDYSWSDRDDDASAGSASTPHVTLGVAVGVAIGVGGFLAARKAVRHVRSRREGVAVTAAPAGWYVDAHDSAQLRYWNGAAWTGHVAPRARAVPAPAAPAAWYVDAHDPTRLRYWDGAAWTGHVAPRAAPAPGPGATVPDTVVEQPRVSMSSAQWQDLVRAWMTAGAVEAELWRMLSHAHIEDADDAILQSQTAMEQLTPQQGADRVRAMLAANPSLRDDNALAEFVRVFRGGTGTALTERTH